MKSKKHTIFLFISLAVFFVSLIVTIVSYSAAKIELDRIITENTQTQVRVGLQLSWFWSMFFSVAILAAELSFIRSVYKMLKYKSNKWVRICYIISACLAFLAVAIYCLIFFKIFSFVSANGSDYTGDICLFVLWPSFIVSFVLGSIPIGHYCDIVDQNSKNISISSD